MRRTVPRPSAVELWPLPMRSFASAVVGHAAVLSRTAWEGVSSGSGELVGHLADALSPTFTLFPSSTHNPIVVTTRSIPEVHGFLSTARFPVTRYRVEKGQHVIEYQDYGLSWRPLLRVVLNERREVLTVGRISH